MEFFRSEQDIKETLLILFNTLLEDQNEDPSLNFVIYVYDNLRKKKVLYEGSADSEDVAKNRIEEFVRKMRPPMHFVMAVYYSEGVIDACYIVKNKIYWLTAKDFQRLSESQEVASQQVPQESHGSQEHIPPQGDSSVEEHDQPSE